MQTAALQKKTTTSTNSHTQKGSATLPAVPVYHQKPIQKMELEEAQPMQAKLTTQLKADITAAPPPTENNNNNNDGTAQLKELEEGMPLQGKFIVQKKELEEELPVQGKFIAQRMELEEEQPIQGKFIIQRKEREDQVPIQPKFKIPSSAATEPKPFQRFALPKSNEPEAVQTSIQRFVLPTQPIQKKANNTGLPDNLKAGVENLSGFSMDDVKVHYNSAKPAQLQAHAYAQGTDIYIAPGQEKHLPHEAWHVVQQKQGRVQATMQMKGGVGVNDDAGLEGEADVMGDMAYQAMADSKDTIVQLYPVSRGITGDFVSNSGRPEGHSNVKTKYAIIDDIFSRKPKINNFEAILGAMTIIDAKSELVGTWLSTNNCAICHKLPISHIEGIIVTTANQAPLTPQSTLAFKKLINDLLDPDPLMLASSAATIANKIALNTATAPEISDLILLIDKSPSNLFIGDSSTNSGIGAAFDHNFDVSDPMDTASAPASPRASAIYAADHTFAPHIGQAPSSPRRDTDSAGDLWVRSSGASGWVYSRV